MFGLWFLFYGKNVLDVNCIVRYEVKLYSIGKNEFI